MIQLLELTILALALLPPVLAGQQVTVTSYGASADAFSMKDGTIDARTPTTLTSRSRHFSVKDTGKTCSIQGAGATRAVQLITTIAAYISPTEVALSSPAGTAVKDAGVICGTDNYSSFHSALDAAAGGHLIIPSGQYLINTQGGTKTLSPASNTVITMDRSGKLFFVGALTGRNTGSALFSIADGETNITFNGLHCVGEFLGLGPSWGSWNWSACITFAGSATTNVQIQNGIFENQMGSGINGKSINVDISHNVFQNDGGTGVNCNGDFADVSDNYSYNDGGFELAGAFSIYSRNRIVNSSGQYALAVGGNTGGQPYRGTVVSNNIVSNPSGGCISVGGGFSYGVISGNTCSGVNGNSPGIANVYDGHVHNDHNLFVNNVVTGTYAGPCFLFTSVTGAILRGNYGQGSSGNCLQINGGMIDSVGNIWSSNGSFNDISNNGGIVRTQDILAGTGRREVRGPRGEFSNDSSFSLLHEKLQP